MEAMEAVRAFDLEWLWAQISFELGLEGEQEPRIKAVFREVRAKRDTLIGEMETKANPDWRILAGAFREVRKDLDKKLREILTEAQWKRLTELEKQREERRKSFRERTPWRGRGSFRMKEVTYAIPSFSLSRASPGSQRPYEELLEQWTVVFGARGQGGFRFSGPGVGRGSNEQFPLIIEATLVDPMLMEVEIERYGKDHGLTGAALTEYRTQYYAENEVDQYIQIRLTLRTSLHESYMDLERWIV